MAVENAVAAAGSSSTVSRFHNIVLRWDYLRLLRESSNKKKCADDTLKSVKSTYQDLEEYIGTFEPLLFEEVKAQIVQGRDEEDSATEWATGMVASCAEANEFQKLTLVIADGFTEELSENDLLLLSKDKFQQGMTPSAYAFAMVEHRGGKDTVTLRTSLSTDIRRSSERTEVESSQRLLKMFSLINTTESILWILKVCSLSTIMREYLALHSVGSLPFKDLILSASEKLSDRNAEDRSWSVPQPLLEFLKNNLNESQLDAIHAGLSRKNFVLIQGPPGTGKTQTILGLLSAVLHATPRRVQARGGSAAPIRRPEMTREEKYNHWIKASPWLYGSCPRDLIMPVDGDDGFYPTGNELKPEIVKSNRKYRMHVLVCAPSNSALDEIVLRVLQTGIRDENDRVYTPKIVRIGLKPHHSVQTVSMDYLVQQKLASVDRSSSGVKNHGAGGALDRDRIRASILDEAAIVFSTLSFSGSGIFSSMSRVFDVVIIDEAAQAVEPATLVPLAHGCRQVFLIGDPVQLPATVISSTAKELGYEKSLFKRFQEANFPVKLLNIQYRMHPQICRFPSEEFYDGSLENGEKVEKQTTRPWHDYRCFGPFSFFDIDGVESQPSGSGSLVNEGEVDFILLLYHKLVNQYPELRFNSQLAVISPYRDQVKLLRKRFRDTFGEQSDQAVDINTVDGFQGREKDVAIFSCVRSNSKKSIGFLADFRRMNVGITRAKSSVIVVGSASTLMHDAHWSNLVNSAKDRNCLFKVSKPYSSFFADANLESLRALLKGKEHVKHDELEEALLNRESMPIDYGEGIQEAVEDIAMDADDGGGADYGE